MDRGGGRSLARGRRGAWLWSRVRNTLKDLRAELGIDQAADIVQAARERGLLDPPASAVPDGAIL